jgi:hypothetical protein
MSDLSSKVINKTTNIQMVSLETMIDINANKTTTTPSVNRPTLQTQKSFKDISRADIRRRLEIRKALPSFHLFLNTFFLSVLVADIMCFLAIVGIVLMITENELTFNRIYEKDTKSSWFIKIIISITTIILLVLILYYHCLDLKYYSNQNSLHDSRIGLTNTKIFLITIELLI